MVLFHKVVDVDSDLNLSDVQELSKQMPGFHKDMSSLREWLIKVSSRGTLISAFDENQLVGLVGFYANDAESKKSFLTVIVVSKEYQGSGVGYKLFREFVRTSLDAGMTQCELNVVKTNERAISFYKRRGLVIAGQGNDAFHYKMTGPLIEGNV